MSSYFCGVIIFQIYSYGIVNLLTHKNRKIYYSQNFIAYVGCSDEYYESIFIAVCM